MMMDAPATPDEPGQPSQTTNMRSLMSATTANGSNGTSQKPVSAKDEFGLPGSAWTNKKAKEEYDLAAAKLVHPQWNMSRLFRRCYSTYTNLIR